MKYHPDRYMRARPFVKNLLTVHKLKAPSGVPTLDALSAVTDSFMNAYNAACVELPVGKRPADGGLMRNEVSLFMHYANFHRHGMNIFDFQPTLGELLRHTDVDDVLLSLIKFPYDSFYIAFGLQPHLDLWAQGYFVDGAYVSRAALDDGIMIEILLTTRRTEIDYRAKSNFILNRDRYYYFPMRLEKMDINVETALSGSIVEHTPFTPKNIPDTSGVYEVAGKQVSVFDRGGESQIEDAHANKEGYPVFLEALKFVINGLCYLSSPSKEINTRFPDDTPKGLLRKLGPVKKQAEIARTMSKLASMGYRKVHFCGDALQKEYAGIPTGRELSAHWRRGHWRNQAYGESFSEHKLLWIMPTVVRKDKGEPAFGHIYDVKDGSGETTGG
jgi:hypothetical protein